jgi:hypothetical protein
MSRPQLRPVGRTFKTADNTVDRRRSDKRIIYAESGLYWPFDQPVDLPELVILRIIQFLPYRVGVCACVHIRVQSACRMERVSKRWRQLVRTAAHANFTQLVFNACSTDAETRVS